MPRFAANLSMMFTEVPFLERFALAAEAGFRGVEYLSPYEHPAGRIREELDRHGLTNVLFNMPPGEWSAGERGLACLPGREAEFSDGVRQAVEYARALGTTRIHAMAGIAPVGVDPRVLRSTYITNLRDAAAELRLDEMTLLIEPINTRDMPGFYLSRQEEAWDVLQEIGAANLKMQMDCYHMQVMEGDVATRLRRYAPHCGHVQIAGVPERQEPDTGELNYTYLLDLLDEIGYEGWVGCEYRPMGRTADGLGWLGRYSGTAVV